MYSLLTRLAAAVFGTVGLKLGVVGRLECGVVGLLEKDPDRKRGNLCGETVLFSDMISIINGTQVSKNSHESF